MSAQVVLLVIDVAAVLARKHSSLVAVSWNISHFGALKSEQVSTEQVSTEQVF